MKKVLFIISAICIFNELYSNDWDLFRIYIEDTVNNQNPIGFHISESFIAPTNITRLTHSFGETYVANGFFRGENVRMKANHINAGSFTGSYIDSTGNWQVLGGRAAQEYFEQLANAYKDQEQNK